MAPCTLARYFFLLFQKDLKPTVSTSGGSRHPDLETPVFVRLTKQG